MSDQLLPGEDPSVLPDFTIKDSGKRAEFDGGMVRDTEDGKIDWSNLFFGPMARRLASHLTKGREKYPDPEPGIPNWTLGRGIDVWLRARRSFLRHQDAWLCGLQDEDHAAAMEFNINLKEYIEERLPEDELAQVRRIEAAYANDTGRYWSDDGEEDTYEAIRARAEHPDFESWSRATGGATSEGVVVCDEVRCCGGGCGPRYTRVEERAYADQLPPPEAALPLLGGRSFTVPVYIGRWGTCPHCGEVLRISDTGRTADCSFHGPIRNVP